ncbi:MAG: RDD family protein [Sulfurimonas sp.]
MSATNEDLERVLHREGITLASIKKRAMAFVIDEVLLSFLLIVAMWDSFIKASDAQEMILLTNQYLFEYLLIKIAYQTFFVMQYGATLGKMAMHIRIIDTQTMDNPSFFSSLNRAIFRVISEMFFYLGFIWGIMDAMRQTWHDKTASTLVIDA